MPTPSSRSWRTTRNRSATSRALSAAVGSSMISTFESKDTALAISTICWRPTVRAVLVEEQAQAAARFAADEDVLRGTEVAHQVEFLVHDADAQRLRMARTADD